MGDIYTLIVVVTIYFLAAKKHKRIKRKIKLKTKPIKREGISIFKKGNRYISRSFSLKFKHEYQIPRLPLN